MTQVEAFRWGLIGAVAPEVLRFFKLVSNGQGLPDLHWGPYGFLLLVYMALAGTITIAWRPDGPWKALWVGASLPALIATLTQTVPAIPK